MKKLLLGENFINTVLNNIEIKDKMSLKLTTRFLMRAIMSGVIVLFGYLLYIALSVNFAGISFGETDFGAFGKLLAASIFPLCLIAIYYTKSELLTSNMMITSIGIYYGKITGRAMVRILGLCFIGNLIGGLFVGLLLSLSTIMNGDMIDYMAHMIEAKEGFIADGNYIDLLVRAIFCNFFINLSMLMVYSGNIKDDFGKCIAMFFGVFVFIYLGLEHSVANTVLFSFGGMYDLVHGTDILNLGLASLNVIVCLIGNFIGGGVLIGFYYAFLNDGRKLESKEK